MNRKENKYIDLSLVRNQNTVAVLFSEILSLSLLESIDLNRIKCNTRESLLLEKSDSESKISVINKIGQDENNHLKHYFSLILDRTNIFHVELNCVYRRKNIIYLDIITSKALNHCNWGDKYTRQIQNKYIMDKFALNLSNLLSLSILKDLINFINLISNDDKILSNEDYKLDFNAGNGALISIISFQSGLLKFSIFYSDKNYYIFFSRTKIGLSYICLEIEKALMIKNK